MGASNRTLSLRNGTEVSCAIKDRESGSQSPGRNAAAKRLNKEQLDERILASGARSDSVPKTAEKRSAVKRPKADPKHTLGYHNYSRLRALPPSHSGELQSPSGATAGLSSSVVQTGYSLLGKPAVAPR